MKLSRSLYALLFLFFAAWVVAHGQTPPTSKNQELTPALKQGSSLYGQLVERVKKGDATVDFVELRNAYAEWLCEDTKTDAPNREAMVEAFKKKEYAKASELAEVVLDYEFVNLGLHLATEDAYRQIANQSQADKHKAIAEKLLNALLRSGDGKTAKTAYHVLSIREEYLIMNQLGYSVVSQALVMENDVPYDVLSGPDKKTGQSVSLYFNISRFFGGCARVKKST